MQALRDPERTRQRILAAALAEFAGKGYAGARMDHIAIRAGVNKRLLYHYFGNKSDLYQEILRRKVAEKTATVLAAPDEPAELLRYWYGVVCQDPEWLRLTLWEALEGRTPAVAEAERREESVQATAQLRASQQAGLLTDQLNAEDLLMVMLALAMFPQAFAQRVQLITGFAADDERLRDRWAACLSVIGGYLRGSPAGSEPLAPRCG